MRDKGRMGRGGIRRVGEGERKEKRGKGKEKIEREEKEKTIKRCKKIKHEPH